MKTIFVLGTTASGKTQISLSLAQELGAPVINCDALQMWSGIGVLSAAPSTEEKEGIVHHLFEFLKPFEAAAEQYNVKKWAADVEEILSTMEAESDTHAAIIVGGTHYFATYLLQHCRKTLGRPILLFTTASTALTERVRRRVCGMLKNGMISEAFKILSHCPQDRLERYRHKICLRDGKTDGVMQAIGLKEFISLYDFLAGEDGNAIESVENLASSYFDSLVPTNYMDISLDEDTPATLAEAADAFSTAPTLSGVDSRKLLAHLHSSLVAIARATVKYARLQGRYLGRLQRQGYDPLVVTTKDTSKWSTVLDSIFSYINAESSSHLATPHEDGIRPSVAAQSDRCPYCNVTLTGGLQIKAHYSGRKHARTKAAVLRRNADTPKN